ncbi:MAG: alpha/beta fold hydrolase, partial [Pseudomonadota bacterium]
MRQLFPLGHLLILLTAIASQAALATDPIVCIDEDDFVPPPVAPAPQAVETGLPRAIYEGATPADLDPNRPVLVFVHGLNGSGDGWFGETMYYGRNDMYDTAYAAGYKAFIVDLFDVGAEAETSIKNGALLQRQISWIRNYWGVDAVNVVAHSKGGPDANFAALVFGSEIDSVVTLGGAHYGSPLADLAQTDWLEWLAELIGFNDSGTKFMQTGCMSLMRDVLDRSPANNDLHFYTAAGTGWGPFLSALEFGGLYLWTVCPDRENDGVVCLEHARHPLSRDANGAVSGQHRLIWDVVGPDFEVDHDKIRRGHGFFDFFWWFEPDDCYVPVFDSIAPYAGQFNAGGARTPVATTPVVTAPPAQPDSTAGTVDVEPVPGNILRGGPLVAGDDVIEFPLEAGVRKLDVRVLTARPDTRVSLVSPNGVVYRLGRAQRTRATFFDGTFVSGMRLDAAQLRDAAGSWVLRMEATADDAYALLVSVESSLALALQAPTASALALPGDAELSVSGGVKSVRVQARVRRTSTARGAERKGVFVTDGGN